MDNDIIAPEESEPLDAIFKEFSPSESSGPTKEPLKTTSTSNETHELVLRREAVPSIVSLFSLKESADADVYRAIEQARLRIGSGQTKA